MSEFKYLPIQSSNLVESAHDGGEKCRVRFKNGVYENEQPISADVFAKFAATFQIKESSGGYFHKNMKQFGFKKIN